MAFALLISGEIIIQGDPWNLPLWLAHTICDSLSDPWKSRNFYIALSGHESHIGGETQHLAGLENSWMIATKRHSKEHKQ